MTLLYVALRLLSFSFLGSSLASERGMATRFGDPGDLLAGEALSCTHQKLQPSQMVCAHRTLPCGTVVVVQNLRNGRLAACEVLDRGPFGATLPSGGWVVKAHRHDPGNWRGMIDLAPAVSDALGHNGRESVKIFYDRALAKKRSIHKSNKGDKSRIKPFSGS